MKKINDFTPTGDLTKTALGDAVAKRLSEVETPDGDTVVYAVLDTVAKTLAAGFKVTVTNFGTWTPVVRKGRVGHNPQTMAKVNIPDKFGIKWTTGPKLDTALNNHDDDHMDIAKAPKKR